MGIKINQNDVVVLFGPTCVGKTSLSLELAQYLNGEIINADSMQIYKHLNVCTAKPSNEQLNSVKHYLIDFLEPDEMYSCGKFATDAEAIIKELIKNQKKPLIVGGSGLYIRALTTGIFSNSEANWKLRQELLLKEKQCPGFLYDYLSRVDKDYAEKILSSDLKRTVRALEVYIETGNTMSQMQTTMTRKTLPYNFIKICLNRNRQELYEMINRRVDKMINSGLIDEIKGLLNYNMSITSKQVIGYKEVLSYLNGNVSLSEVIEQIKKATRRYAKRQLIWFRKETNTKWVDISGIFDTNKALEKLMLELN
ncbi:tRNA delta(2)-isopentenylpyrophosphate transferase [Candidatus Magnetoovum chiemensis]|nr:tRNA delta(2)-isopentenylpyrophosphate transferase [Candidatus Magnetoovum chiemensis]